MASETNGDDAHAWSVLDAMGDPVVAIGPDVRLLFANRAAEARFGWPRDELVGRSVVDLAHPDDLETGLLSLASVLDKETGTLLNLRIRDADGTYSNFEVRGRTWVGGPVEGAVVLNLREVSDRDGWDVAGGDQERLRQILDHLPTLALVLSPEGAVVGANRALTRLLHRGVEATRGGPVLDLVDPRDRDIVAAELSRVVGTGGAGQFEAIFLTREGEPLPMSVNVVDLTGDRTVGGIVVVAHDITPLVDARRELDRLARIDDLTGLPNRISLRDHLRDIIEVRPARATVLFGDVDGLKAVNDRYGHRAGDALLAAVAARIRTVVRPEDFVARLSGDEFVVVVASADAAVVRRVQERIASSMLEPIVLPDGHRVTTTISIGAALVEPTLDVEDLLASADSAMYVAKRERDRAR